MVRGYTTIEQSKKLLSLGLDQSTADMCYIGTEREHILHAESYSQILKWRKDYKKESNAPFSTTIIPAWSLTALLELMPIGSHIEKKNGGYACYVVYTKPLEASTPIEAAFEMVCWLIEQGHIKVNK